MNTSAAVRLCISRTVSSGYRCCSETNGELRKDLGLVAAKCTTANSCSIEILLARRSPSRAPDYSRSQPTYSRIKLILGQEYGDLSSGETAQSTTDFGLNMLETIRATTDKK